MSKQTIQYDQQIKKQVPVGSEVVQVWENGVLAVWRAGLVESGQHHVVQIPARHFVRLFPSFRHAPHAGAFILVHSVPRHLSFLAAHQDPHQTRADRDLALRAF